MAKSKCEESLSHLEYLRAQVQMYATGLKTANGKILVSFDYLTTHQRDPAALSTLDGVLSDISSNMAQVETYLDAWEKDAGKFAKENLAPVEDKIKKNKQQKKQLPALPAACAVVSGHHSLHLDEVKATRSLLADLKPMYNIASKYAEQVRSLQKKP